MFPSSIWKLQVFNLSAVFKRILFELLLVYLIFQGITVVSYISKFFSLTFLELGVLS